MLAFYLLVHLHSRDCSCISLGPELLVIYTEFLSCLLLSFAFGHIVPWRAKIVEQPIPARSLTDLVMFLSPCRSSSISFHSIPFISFHSWSSIQISNVQCPSHCLKWSCYILSSTLNACNYIQDHKIPTKPSGKPLSSIAWHNPFRSM